MAEQIYRCEFCGYNCFGFTSINKKLVKEHEEVCELNSNNKSCKSCGHYKDYDGATFHFSGGWWCEIQRENAIENNYNITDHYTTWDCKNWKHK